MAEKNQESAQGSRTQQTGSGPQSQPTQAKGERGTSPQGTERQRGQQTGLQRGVPAFLASGLSPFGLMRRMMEDMDRMFEGLSERQGAGLAQLWAPPIEILERNGRFVVRADLPGLSADDVRIEVRDHGLILEGERKSEIEVEEEGGVYRSERTYGRFSREIPMPDGVDVDKAQARFENGVLEIEIPLREDARRRRIEIQGGSPRPAPGDKAVH